ncbi:MAG: hypothetical protein GY772_15515, partial [bacterium]|nr:hypothetical protein [bacterium]
MKYWIKSNPHEPLAIRYHEAVAKGARNTISSMISEWASHPRCTSKVVKSQSLSEGNERQTGCRAKSYQELVQQFGENGAAQRAAVYSSFPDEMLVSAGADPEAKEHRWYLVPET